jgi:hypothetical protein
MKKFIFLFLSVFVFISCEKTELVSVEQENVQMSEELAVHAEQANIEITDVWMKDGVEHFLFQFDSEHQPKRVLKSTSTGIDLDDPIDYIDGSVPSVVTGFVGSVSYDSNINHSTSGTGSVKLTPGVNFTYGSLFIDMVIDEDYYFSMYSSIRLSKTGNYFVGFYNLTETIGYGTGTHSGGTSWNTKSATYLNLDYLIDTYSGWDWSDDIVFLVHGSVSTAPFTFNVDKIYCVSTVQTVMPIISGEGSASFTSAEWASMGYQYTTGFSATYGRDEYEWEIVSGSGISFSSTSVFNPTITFTTSGTKIIKCRVKDHGKGWSDWDNHYFNLYIN